MVSRISGPPPETAEDRTQTKDTHSVPEWRLRFLSPPGIELGPPDWKTGTTDHATETDLYVKANCILLVYFILVSWPRPTR